MDSVKHQEKLIKNMKEIKKEIPLSKEEQEVLDLIGASINGVTWENAIKDL